MIAPKAERMPSNLMHDIDGMQLIPARPGWRTQRMCCTLSEGVPGSCGGCGSNVITKAKVSAAQKLAR
jgi:hypothetical protein